MEPIGPSRSNPWNNIPADLLCSITDRLEAADVPQAALVCRQWKKALSESLLERREQVRFGLPDSPRGAQGRALIAGAKQADEHLSRGVHEEERWSLHVVSSSPNLSDYMYSVAWSADGFKMALLGEPHERYRQSHPDAVKYIQIRTVPPLSNALTLGDKQSTILSVSRDLIFDDSLLWMGGTFLSQSLDGLRTQLNFECFSVEQESDGGGNKVSKVSRAFRADIVHCSCFEYTDFVLAGMRGAPCFLLNRFTDRQAITLDGIMADDVRHFSMSRTRRTICIATGNETVSMFTAFDVKSGSRLGSVSLSRDPISGGDWLPVHLDDSGAVMFNGYGFPSLGRWPVQTNEFKVARLGQEIDAEADIQTSSDGAQTAMLSKGKEIVVLNWREESLETKRIGHVRENFDISNDWLSFDWSPNGRYLAYGFSDFIDGLSCPSTLVVYDTKLAQEQLRLHFPDRFISSWAPDSYKVAVARAALYWHDPPPFAGLESMPLRIYRRDNQIPLFSGGGDAFCASEMHWSMDGRLLWWMAKEKLYEAGVFSFTGNVH